MGWVQLKAFFHSAEIFNSSTIANVPLSEKIFKIMNKIKY